MRGNVYLGKEEQAQKNNLSIPHDLLACFGEMKWFLALTILLCS